jgi:peptidoglycan/xylan/chitin deacetylase (PgdA/CDA1 family)
VTKAALRDLAYRAAAAAAGPARPLRAILMFHEVDGPAGPSLEVFRRQLAFVADVAAIVRLDAFVHDAGDEDAAAVALTFDDGDRRTCELAGEALSDAGIVATFFLPSRLLGTTFETSFGPRELIDADGARALAAAGHEIGAHTRTHPRLTAASDEDLAAEVKGSRTDLEELLGAPVPSFAYPKGDHDGRVVAAVRDAGFSRAVTVREGLVRSDGDVLALPRIAVRASTGTAQLRAKLTRGVELYERLRGRG